MAGEITKQILKYATDYHAPVLCHAVLQGLITDKSGIYVDATFGGGGHTAAMLDVLNDDALVIGIDQDPEAIAEGEKRLSSAVSSGRLKVVAGNFGNMENLVRSVTEAPVNGILMDLGVSSHQLDEGSRGFSHKNSGPLDMRMDSESALDADVIVNTWSHGDMVRIFRQFGEEPRAVEIARGILAARPIESTGELAEVVRKHTHILKEAKTVSRIFQAIRIAVNEELDVLEQALTDSVKLLKTGGRLCAISYHSLEDRRVKRFLRSGNFKGQVGRDFYGNSLSPFSLITRKPVSAEEDEQTLNRRSRSARMRIGERTDVNV